jgi:hypothetical protein
MLEMNRKVEGRAFAVLGKALRFLREHVDLIFCNAVRYFPSTPSQIIYLSTYGSTALCWTLAALQFLDLLHSR